MDDPLSRGLPFELTDVWRRSSLHVKKNERSLFAPLDATFPPLELDNDDRVHEYDLVIPPLNTSNGSSTKPDLEPPESDIASPPSELWHTGQSPSDDNASVWDLGPDLCLPPEKPLIHTWEAFEKTKNAAAAERTAYLSEAGSKAFDAAFAKHRGKSDGVLPQDVMLRALCNLAVGCESVFFRWNEAKACFNRTLEDVPISGYSTMACDSFILQMMNYATSYRSLRASCTDVRPRKLALPCAVAFYGCANNVLDAVEESITRQLGGIPSILQLQALVERPRGILSILRQLFDMVKKAKTDEDIISAVSDHVHQVVSAENEMAAILRVVLRRTSAPWLKNLATDVGLADDMTMASAGIEDEEEATNMSELGISTDETRAATHASHGVMTSEDRAMIQDTKASLKILRKSAPLHSRRDNHAQQLFQDATTGNDDGSDGGEDVPALVLPGPSDTNKAQSSPYEDGAWATDDIQHDFLAQLDSQISHLSQPSTSQTDPLASAVHSYCNSPSQIRISPPVLTLPTNPLDRLRPALQAQNTHLNRTLLRHLFTSNLTHHLRLHHAYHHLTSGEFVTRLCTALFSTGDETQSAERRRGAIPTGQRMGLRLGGANETGEKRWPPASSELRLTLVDVLAESYTNDFPAYAAERSPGTKELPGGLSFSIRELPEHEIERVMDASSLYALDFLRLQYAAPAPLDAVLTPRSMETYDSIFRQLLRFLRVGHVTSQRRRDVGRRQRTSTDDAAAKGDGERARFAHRAHHLANTLYTHFMSLGIAGPWQSFMRTLSSISSNLDNSKAGESVVSIQALRQMHLSCLDTLRGRLFLRRKQEKLRMAVEDVLGAILAGVGGDGLRNLDAKVTELLGLLRKEVERLPKTNGTTANDDDDEKELLRMLLVRLDWNGSYSRDGPGT